MKYAFFGSVAFAAFAMTGSAHAADLKAAPVYKAPLAATYNWTGFYLGVNAGIGASQTHSSFADFPANILDRSGTGFAGGIQAGFNWQFAPQWVAGIEGDIGYLGIKRSFPDLAVPGIELGVKSDWYGTLRGRLGYTNGGSLFYATGGAAIVKVTNNSDDISTNNFASNSDTASGWVVGGGIETMLGGNWSAKAEYLYIDAGSQDVFNPSLADTVHFDNRFHIYRYGLNYKFGGPAVAGNALPAHNWTGFYAGVNAGAGLSHDHATIPISVGAVDVSGADFTGGAEVGYNWQFSQRGLVGLEGDFGWLRINHSVGDFSGAFGVKTNWYGTLRGRVGYSTGQALLYGTGGAAFVNVRNNFDRLVTPGFLASKSQTTAGWTIGGGIEAVVAQNWTAKTEYLYIDAGSQDVTNANFAGGTTAHFENRFHVFRFGLNYRFGG
jgi:outer membrane immunogenic protein